MTFRHKRASPSYLIEPIRGVIQRLSVGAQHKPKRIIAFISARSGEGTSTVATCYAETLAVENSQRVLLIDAGRLSRKRFKALDVDPSIGIVDLLAEGHPPDDAIHPLGENLSVARWVGREERRASASKMLHNPDYWQALLASFGSIIIDAPSLQHSFDGVMLAAKADTAVIVVEAEKTPQPVIRNLQNNLEAAGADIAGIILNKRRYYIPERVYRKL